VLVLVALVAAGAAALSAQAMRNVPRVSVDELQALIDRQAVVVVDVRDPGQFSEGRIPGAVNIDYTEMMAKGARFKGETRTIVTYCACVNETTAARAALDLAALGIPGAKALRGGWMEWKERGMAVEK
jgi:rhodanese-related sulfurtransferase